MSLLDSALAILAPPECVGCGREGLALCRDCTAKGVRPYGQRCAFCGALSRAGRTCGHCRRPGAPRFVWVSATHELLAQELVKRYKFGHLRAAAPLLAGLMTTEFRRYNPPVDYLLVPLPTATAHIRQRGFDHSELLAKQLSRRLGRSYAQALGRLGQSHQMGANRAVRLAQQSGNFFVRQPQRVAGRDILLIDDVITTGGSVLAASRALRTAGARHVDALVFAKRL